MLLMVIMIFTLAAAQQQADVERSIDLSIERLKQLSMTENDTWFFMNYDVLSYLESLAGRQMPRDLEHAWQMRRNKRMGDTFWTMYQWVAEGRTSAEGYV